jgi:hypothetical protein
MAWKFLYLSRAEQICRRSINQLIGAFIESVLLIFVALIFDATIVVRKESEFIYSLYPWQYASVAPGFKMAALFSETTHCFYSDKRRTMYNCS